MQRFDRFVGAGHGRGPDELPEKLAAEHSVVFQLLASALEHRDVVGTGSLAVLDVQIKLTEQIGPEIGHAASVSKILADR
jgi:hypothetical protein